MTPWGWNIALFVVWTAILGRIAAFVLEGPYPVVNDVFMQAEYWILERWWGRVALIAVLASWWGAGAFYLFEI